MPKRKSISLIAKLCQTLIAQAVHTHTLERKPAVHEKKAPKRARLQPRTMNEKSNFTYDVCIVHAMKAFLSSYLLKLGYTKPG